MHVVSLKVSRWHLSDIVQVWRGFQFAEQSIGNWLEVVVEWKVAAVLTEMGHDLHAWEVVS